MRKFVLTAACGFVLSAAPAFAADMVTKAPPPPAAPASWWDTLSINGHVEAGGNVNNNNSDNFGSLFTDKGNTFLLNQAMLTVQRPLNPKATGYDFGFKFQVMYGSDARYTHFLGEFDESISGRNQFDIVEAHALFHLPWFTAGGMDMKLGQYVTLEGAEVIDATGNALYSHSYIFNFGIPFKHTGIMTTTHVNPTVDIYAGIDTGVNTTFGNHFNCIDCGDNNTAVAFHGGVGLNLMGGALTILATTHIGPENPNVSAVVAAGVNPNSALRYLNDVTTIWKVNDKLTLTNDLNYIRDDGFNADGYGVAQYFTYQLYDWLAVQGRAEIWRDNKGFFVASFPCNLCFVQIEHGDPAGIAISGGATTYSEFTLGLNIKPTVPKAFEGLVIRPEIRYDASLNGTTPYGGGTKRSQFTAAADIIIPFTVK